MNASQRFGAMLTAMVGEEELDEMIFMLPEPHPYYCGCPECSNYEQLLFDKAQVLPVDPNWEPPF